MRSALRKLCQHGIEALRPQRVNDRWRSPMVSKRVAADLRKAAIRSGTYGTFDAETGIGWDPIWDSPQRSGVNAILGSNQSKIHSMRPPKEHKHDRTREARAQKIEALLAQADDKIEEFRLEIEAKKPKPGIEEVFKKMSRGARN